MLTFEEIRAKLLGWIAEASKILHLDDSLSTLRSNLQSQLASDYRTANPTADYYAYPYIVDVYGDKESGQCVYMDGKGQYFMADFKSNKDGSYTFSKEKAVKRSYVAESEGGLVTKESIDMAEMALVQEAKLGKNGLMRIKLIAPGAGSMGYYTVESLKQAASDKVFPKGTQMFFDHPTAEERQQSGTGSVLKLAAAYESDAVYEEKGPDGPGLYADVKPYKDAAPFIVERAKDIGVSVAARIERSKDKYIGGVPVVNRFVEALSTDFVSRAGAGGKISTIYESFISHQGENRRQEEGEEMSLTADQEKLLKDAAEAAKLLPGVVARLDRAEEMNRGYQVRDIVSAIAAESGLPEKGKARVIRAFAAPHYAPPVKDGRLDVEAVTEAAKAVVKDEVEHYQEAGHKLQPVVRGMGGDPPQSSTGGVVGIDDKQVAEAAKTTDDAINSIMGFTTEKKAS